MRPSDLIPAIALHTGTHSYTHTDRHMSPWLRTQTTRCKQTQRSIKKSLENLQEKNPANNQSEVQKDSKSQEHVCDGTAFQQIFVDD